jgi:hypothetical protein
VLSRTDRHPADGVLRRLVDEPAGVPDAERAHVAGCPACLTRLAGVQQDAAAAAAALATAASPGPADVDRAWQRFTAAAPAAAPRPAERPAPRPAARRRRLARGPLAAAVGAVVLLGGAGVAAAADWLPVFSTQQVAPVQVRAADLVALPDLSAYGDLDVVSQPDLRTVAGAAAAREATGLEVPEVADLPDGVTGRPQYSVGDQVVAQFTFSAARAAQAAAAAGTTPPPVPPGLDGARFRLVAGPGVAETWSEGRGVPALVVARATAPTAFSSGVPFATARDYVLSLPGVPAGLAEQLRAFTGDGTTLPIPVPADLATTSTTDVGGHPATVVTSRDGSVSGVVWVEDGVVTAVAGSLGEDEVLAVARALR